MCLDVNTRVRSKAALACSFRGKLLLMLTTHRTMTEIAAPENPQASTVRLVCCPSRWPVVMRRIARIDSHLTKRPAMTLFHPEMAARGNICFAEILAVEAALEMMAVNGH
jgi:hypothetical protein